MNVNKISFKGALININAMSDTHGMLENSAAAYEVIKNNADDVFISEGKGKRNLFMVAGDWFMAGETEGYLSKPDYYAQDFQLDFFNEFIKKMKEFSKNMQTFFTIGNHDLDCGAKKLNDSISKLDAITVSGNLDLEKSNSCTENFNSGKLKNSHIIEIEDDKDPDITHGVLVLGLSPVNMSYYNKKTDDMVFKDDIRKPQIELSGADYEKTIEELDKQIKAFKGQYPNGVVILMSHCGAKAAETLVERNKDVNLVLDGHEHKDSEEDFNDEETKFIRLSRDFRKLENIKIKIDDNGKVTIKPQKYSPNINNRQINNEMSDYFKTTFKQDLEEIYPVKSESEELEYLDVANVRSQNNHLANYVNDVILSEIKKIDPSIEIFGLNASAFRSGLPTSCQRSANNLELILVLNGLKEYSADIFVNEISGQELIEIISQNLKFNARDPETNPLMQYSGLIVDKNLRNFDTAKTPFAELRKYVRLEKTGKPVDLEQIYKIANVEKWLIKSEYTDIWRMNRNAVQLEGANAKRLFTDYFEKLSRGEIENQIAAKKKYRII